MSKVKSQYKCTNCNNILPKWSGQCSHCNSWDSIIEYTQELKIANFNKTKLNTPSGNIELSTLDQNTLKTPRIITTITEFDHLLGGGIVPGSVILIGGNPGIGKSTLILQILNSINNQEPVKTDELIDGKIPTKADDINRTYQKKQNINSIYFSGEESINQIKIRAKRLSITESNIQISTVTEVTHISSFLRENPEIKFVVIDSIQTTYVKELGNAPGSTNQLRNSTLEFTDLAKKHNITFILIGHVTKDGQIAGPKLIEHMVDTVLYFEEAKNSNYRILRAHKNRYGATNELAIFEMVESGLKEVNNPSEIFLQEYNENTTGTAIFPLIEGTRTILLELQSLVAKSYMASPRRTVVGWDQNRLAIILAVLNSRMRKSTTNYKESNSTNDFNQMEVYFSVAGGLKITEPAADLAACAALISAIQNKVITKKTIFFGEIGLSGEIRNVTNPESRLKEAKKLGFKIAVIPKLKKTVDINGIKTIHISHINELLDFINSAKTY